MEGHGKAELLAPAGNEAGFYGAVNAGADAVYLAGNRFGARAYAENFTAEGLTECIRYGHLFGRKIYLTVNTLFKEDELSELDEYLTPFYEAGLDAVIVQDIGVFRHIRERFPGLELHASTQMTLCSGYGAALLKEMGASRIVPARELSLRELAEIKRHTDIELETFIHGAMCYCYSGQCLFSSILGGRSGNRGRCAQPCRLPYGVKSENKSIGECYPLSLKDMCTVEHIPQLIEAGIDSFKIEGRMKKPEYAAGVTAVYRKYIDRYYRLREKLSAEEAANAYHVEKADLKLLSSLYIRSEIQDGYYFRHNGREMVTLQSPAYSVSDEAMLEEISGKYLEKRLKLPIAISAKLQTGKPACVTLRWQELEAGAKGAVVEQAKNQPITEENVKKQLGKLGESSFSAAAMQLSVGEDAFFPLKQINELRREAVSGLEQLILSKNGYEEKRLAPPAEGAKYLQRQGAGPAAAVTGAADGTDIADKTAIAAGTANAAGWVFSLQTMEQLSAICDWISENAETAPARIYVDGDLLIQKKQEALTHCRRLLQYSELWITLPYIMRSNDRAYMEQLCVLAVKEKFSGFLVRSLDEIGYLTSQRTGAPGLKLRTDAGLYAWNTEALQELSCLGSSGSCLPYELNGAEQRRLLRTVPGGALSFEKIVYSRIPMMITANCVLRTADKCRKNSGGQVRLADRMRKEFAVFRNCLHCMNIIYNSVPYSLHHELSKWKHMEKRLDFTLETGDETRAVLKSFLKGEGFSEGNEIPFDEYTTGHEKRGVE